MLEEWDRWEGGLDRGGQKVNAKKTGYMVSGKGGKRIDITTRKGNI